MTVELTHLVDLGLLVVALYVTYSINNITNLLLDVVEKHNNLSAMFKDFSQAVAEDMEEIERFLNDEQD